MLFRALALLAALIAASPIFAQSIGPRPPGTATPVGTNGQLQYNSSGAIGGKNLYVGNTWYVAKNGNDANPCTIDALCLTIGHALSIANSGDVVNVSKGSYAESLTLLANISINCDESRGVAITGTVTASFTGTTFIHHCDLGASSGNVLSFSGANATKLELHDVHLDGASGASDTISYTNTNAGSKLTLEEGVVSAAVSTSARAIKVGATAAGSIQLYEMTVEVLDNPTHVAFEVNGSVAVTHVSDVVQGQITVAGTGVYNGTSMRIDTGSVASLVTNSASATPSTLTNVVHTTSAHPLVTGAGAFAQGLNVFAGTGYDFAATLTGGLGALPVPAAPLQIHAATLAPAAGLASGLLDGMLEYDGTHIYIVIGTTRKQLDN